jgi:hypothetical protein
MSDALRIAFSVSAVLTGVLLALDLIALLEFRFHLIAWMRHQEEINRLLRKRVEQLERLSNPPATDEERKALTEASDFYTATRTGVALSGLLMRLGGWR